MTYYLSGALKQQSGSITHVVTGSISDSFNDYTQYRELQHLDLAPGGEYFLETSYYGSGSYDYSAHDYDPSINIWQSSSAAGGFKKTGIIKIKGSRALDSNLIYADAPNFASPVFIDDSTILWYGQYLDDPGTDAGAGGAGSFSSGKGVFGVITGSGANWGFSQTFEGGGETTTAQSRDDNPGNGSGGTIGTFGNATYDAAKITVNNQYVDTAPTRAAIHNCNDHDTSPNWGTITFFKQSGGTWSFHSQFGQQDWDDYIQGSFPSTGFAVQDMAFIDEDNIVVIWYYNSGTNYSYMTPFTFDNSQKKWIPSQYDGSNEMNTSNRPYAHRMNMGSTEVDMEDGTRGHRWVVYDPYEKRLLVYEGASSNQNMYEYHSGSDWLANDIVGANLARGSGASSVSLYSINTGFEPFYNPRQTRWKFGSGSATAIAASRRSMSPGSNAYRNWFSYFESSSAGGWMTYDRNASNISDDHFSDPSSLNLNTYLSDNRLSLYTATPIQPGGFAQTPWAWNGQRGGDGNTFLYKESLESGNTSTGLTNRVPVINFSAFPAANPSLNASVTETVGTGGGTVKAGGTANSPTITVTVGSGDLDGDTSLTAAVVSDASVKAQNLTAIKTEAGSSGAHFVGDIIRLTPHGTEFNSAVQVQFVLDSAPADLTIWKRDSHDGDHTQWYQLPSTYWSASGTTITINTTRFSEYAGLGGINVARTKLSNTQLATLTTTDLVASTSIQISGSSNSFKDRTVAGDDLFLIEDKSNGTTYHISASQMSEYFGGLVNVTASGQNVDMKLTMVTPSDTTDVGLEVDAGLLYNPSSNTLKGTNLSGSGDLTIAGNATIDDNIVATKGYIQIADDNLHVTGNILSSGLIKGTTLSGSGDLTIAGSATVDDNVVVTKGYVHIADDNLHVTGNVLSSGLIKGTTLSGSGDLTIAGSATIDDNVTLTKGYLEVRDDNAFISGSAAIKLPASGQFVVRDSSNAAEFAVDENGDVTFGSFAWDTSANTTTINSVIKLNGTTGMVSGSNLVSAGNVTADDNIIATKGYVQVKAGHVHVTGNVLAQQVKGTAISGSGNLTIAGDATIAGDFTVNGDLTYINTTNLAVEDSLILLGSGSSGSPVNDQGIILERGASANAAVVFDESADRFAFAYVGTASAGSTGNLDVALGAPVSASAFFGDGSNLTGVGAQTIASNNDNNDLALTFVSGAGLAAAKLFTDASILKYNTNTDTLKGKHLSGSGDLSIAGSATIDDNLVITKGYVHVAADNMHITGAVLASSHISGAGNLSAGGTLAVDGAATLRNTLTVSGGNISGSADFTLAGSATVDDNLVLTKGYVQVKADNMHVTGNVLASGLIKGSTISGSGDLTIAGSATIDDNAVLTKGYLQIAADNAHVTGAIFATSHVSGGGNFSAAGTLSVAGLISGSSGMDLAGTADFGGAVNVQGLLSGSGGLDIGGVADFGAAVNIQGALDVDGNTTVDVFTASDTATFGGAVNLGDSGADAIVVSGALDVGSQNTKFRSNQIEMLNLDSMALDSNDSTHFLLVQDSDNNYVKKESVTDLVQHITGAAGTKGGLQVHQGKLFIAQKEESFMSASLTGHAHTASMSGPVLSGSLMVFLNGLLQTRSGSANLGAGANSIWDYRLDSYTAPTKVLMSDALDSDDVLIVRYIQK